MHLKVRPDDHNGSWLRVCLHNSWASDIGTPGGAEAAVPLARLELETFSIGRPRAATGVWLTMASLARLVAVQIDPRSPEHPYQQLARQLREQIGSGKIASQLPSITQLTEETGLAVGTVRRAINTLVKEGLVQTVPGRGTFVKS